MFLIWSIFNNLITLKRKLITRYLITLKRKHIISVAIITITLTKSKRESYLGYLKLDQKPKKRNTKVCIFSTVSNGS